MTVPRLRVYISYIYILYIQYYNIYPPKCKGLPHNCDIFLKIAPYAAGKPPAPARHDMVFSLG